MMTWVFWISFAVVLYVYVGYPALLAFWARFSPKQVRSATWTPPVSVVIAARNEATALPSRLRNLLLSDYPPDCLEIIVVSDGSTDETRRVVEAFSDDVELVEVPAGGKARALNAGVERARHDILVFTDARQRFTPSTIRGLVAPLIDPAVGGVSGELILDAERSDARATDVGDGVGAYWRFEKWLRRRESLVWSTVGTTGAVYALRREYWQPLPPDTILDDVLVPMRAVLAGARVVFDGRARAYDHAVPAAADEFKRKTRTLAGNFQLLALEPRLLNPLGNPIWIQFVSHKLGRLIVPYALLAVLVTSAALAREQTFYALALAAQVGFYGLAVYGAALARRGRVETSPRQAKPDVAG